MSLHKPGDASPPYRMGTVALQQGRSLNVSFVAISRHRICGTIRPGYGRADVEWRFELRARQPTSARANPGNKAPRAQCGSSTRRYSCRSRSAARPLTNLQIRRVGGAFNEIAGRVDHEQPSAAALNLTAE